MPKISSDDDLGKYQNVDTSTATVFRGFGYLTAVLRGEADKEFNLDTIRKWAMNRPFYNQLEINQEVAIRRIYKYLCIICSKDNSGKKIS